MKNAPHCHVQISIEMELQEAHQPLWVSLGEGVHGNATKHMKRKFWKCPLKDCRRVAAYLPTDEEEKEMSARTCPRCGAPTDASGISRAIGNHLCRKCIREKWQTRRGLGKGFHARAKARRLAKNAAVIHFSAPQAEPELPDDAANSVEMLLDAWRDLPAKEKEVRA